MEYSNEMTNLGTTPVCDKKIIYRGRHCSMGNLIDRGGDTREELSVRLSSTYRSARCPRWRESAERVAVVIDEKDEKKNDIMEDDDDDDDDDSVRERMQEIDAGEPPPIDESLFFDNLSEAPREEKTNGMMSLKRAMCSAVSLAEMKILMGIERGESPPVDCEKSAKSNIAYVWACFRGLIDLLPKLEASGAKLDYVEPLTGINAILAASLSGSVDCLKHLIDRGLDVNYASPISNYTSLHIAAFGNFRQVAELLLDNGAIESINDCDGDCEPVLHTAVRAKSCDVAVLLLERGASVALKNHQGETALHVACLVKSLECVEALLKRTPIGIDAINSVDRAQRTALHRAVMSSSVDLVDILVKHGASVNSRDMLGLTPLHIAALNEQSRCVDSLVWAGADLSATTNTGLSALNVILRKIPESLETFRRCLDASIRLERPVAHNREFEMRFHFDRLLPYENPCETSFINTFVQEHRKDLLSHPLVMAFLHLKWEKIRKFYLIRIFLYATTVVCMTTYVLTALAYKCYNRDDEGASKLCTTGTNTTIANQRLVDFLFRKTAIEIEWYTSVFLTCITIPRKIFGFMVYKSAKQYFTNVDNLLDGVVIVSVFVTSFVYTGRTYDWQNYVGAFAILCAWTNLMLMIGQLPAFGTYVAMFTHIQFEFAKLLLAYSGLLIGFTISFCLIFVSEPSFGNPFTGLIKVLAMMAGELDFEALMNQADQRKDGNFIFHHPLSVCSQILFTLFLLFVTVILMNLLVGIAVHDIQGLRNHAGLTKLVRQTKLIIFTEMILQNARLPGAFREWMSDHDINVENRKRILVVKPLNPLEKRLPKEILKAAYEIALRRVAMPPSTTRSDDGNDDALLCEHVASMRHHPSLNGSLDKLSLEMAAHTQDLCEIKKQLLDNNRILADIMSKITGEKKISRY